MSEAPHHAACRCGAVRFELHGTPTLTAWCHCASCRKATGAPAAAFADFSRDQVRLAAGEPVRFASSPGVTRSFCGTCGSTLTFESRATPDEISVHIGILERPQDFAPTATSHAAERLPWFPG